MKEDRYAASRSVGPLTLYERLGTNIWSTKKQQWHVSYYGALANVVLVGFVIVSADDMGLILRSLPFAERAVMLALSFGFFIFGLVIFVWITNTCGKLSPRATSRWAASV